LFVGRLVGCGVGFGVGCFVGLNVGEVDIVGDAEDGELLTVGWVEGRSEGWVEGTSDGSDVFLSASNWAINAAARCASSLLCNSIPPMTPRTVKAPMEMTIDPPTTASLVFEHLHVVDTMVVFR